MKSWKEILCEIDKYRKLDENIQSKYDALFDVIAHVSYVPIIEVGVAQSYIEGICVTHKDSKALSDWLEYYAYDAKHMKGSATVTTKEGKEYNFKKQKEAVAFLEEFYPISVPQ